MMAEPTQVQGLKSCRPLASMSIPIRASKLKRSSLVNNAGPIDAPPTDGLDPFYEDARDFHGRSASL